MSDPENEINVVRYDVVSDDGLIFVHAFRNGLGGFLDRIVAKFSKDPEARAMAKKVGRAGGGFLAKWGLAKVNTTVIQSEKGRADVEHRVAETRKVDREVEKLITDQSVSAAEAELKRAQARKINIESVELLQKIFEKSSAKEVLAVAEEFGLITRVGGDNLQMFIGFDPDEVEALTESCERELPKRHETDD